MTTELMSIPYAAPTGSSMPNTIASTSRSEFGTSAIRPTVFNRQYALSRLGGLEDVLYDIMELMTSESVMVHATINSACDRRDSVELKRAAHTLKGAASIAGASDLVARLKRIEEFATAGKFDCAAVEFPEIDRQFAELQSILAIELQHKPSTQD